MTPSATPNCPSPCHALDQYAQNTSLFAGQANISLVFLKGVHNLRNNLTISGLYHNPSIAMLVFQGQGALPEDTILDFSSLASIYLSDIANIHILNIQMNGSKCGIVVLNSQVLIIQGCEFLNVQQYAIEIHRSILTQPDIVIQHCRFVGGNVGISIWDVSNLKLSIQSCEFLDESTGIEIYGKTLIQDSMDSILIHHCWFTVNAQCGISIRNVSTLLIQHCEFYTNQHELNGTGVYIENSRNTVIRNSTFIGVKQGIWAVKNTQILVIQGCEFQNVEYASISIFYYTTTAVVHDRNTLLIQQCLFVNGEYGILTVNAQNASILDCDFRNIEQSGIKMSPMPKYLQYLQPPFNSDIRIENCTIIGGDYGVVIFGLVPYWLQSQ